MESLEFPLVRKLCVSHNHLLLEQIREDPRDAEILIEGTEYIRCEIEQAARREMIVTLEDFLRRRSKISQVARKEVIRRSPGVMEACRVLFGAEFEIDVGIRVGRRVCLRRCQLWSEQRERSTRVRDRLHVAPGGHVGPAESVASGGLDASFNGGAGGDAGRRGRLASLSCRCSVVRAVTSGRCDSRVIWCVVMTVIANSPRRMACSTLTWRRPERFDALENTRSRRGP